MSSHSSLPGGPPRPEFRDAIERLAEEAREQDRVATEKIRKLLRQRPISRFIRVGIALVAVELVLLGVMYKRRQQQVTTVAQANSPVLVNNCPAVLYKTYWQIAAYTRDQGHPPATLNDLVGKYLDTPPADPASGKSLVYSTDGTRFDVRCPGGAPSR